ncbi:MAG: TetR/AcrR family transcriptional regulator [Ferruginibacter sp.]
MAKIKTAKNTSKRTTIIQKAAELFKEKSYASASMRELADNLGVEAPSLYNHIGSKSELLESICNSIGESFIQQLEEIAQSNEPTIKKIETIIRFHIRMMVNNFNEVYVANHEWKQLTEPHLSNFLNIRRNYEKGLVQLVEKGIQEKICRDINPYVAVLTILSAVRGLEFWQRNKKNISPQLLEDEMVNHLLNGLIQ